MTTVITSHAHLADAGQDERVKRSLAFRLAVHYYQILWGFFSDGSTHPDPSMLAAFYAAVAELTEIFHLDLPNHADTVDQVRAWVPCIRHAADEATTELVTSLEITMDEGMTYRGDDTIKRLLIQTYIGWCYLEHRHFSVNEDQTNTLRLRVNQSIAQLVELAGIVTGASNSAISATSYQRVFVHMQATLGQIHHPNVPVEIVDEVPTMPLPSALRAAARAQILNNDDSARRVLTLTNEAWSRRLEVAYGLNAAELSALHATSEHGCEAELRLLEVCLADGDGELIRAAMALDIGVAA